MSLNVETHRLVRLWPTDLEAFQRSPMPTHEPHIATCSCGNRYGGSSYEDARTQWNTHHKACAQRPSALSRPTPPDPPPPPCESL